MYAGFWVVTGQWVLNQNETYSTLVNNDSIFHDFVQTNYNVKLPDQASPVHLEKHLALVTQIVAGFQITMGVLSALEVDNCPLFLSILMTILILLCNDPLQYSNLQEFYANCGSWALNLGLIGAGLLMYCDETAPKVDTTSDKKNRKAKAEEEKPEPNDQQATSKQGKGGNQGGGRSRENQRAKR